MSHSRRRIRIQNICRRIVFSILSRALRGKFERAEMRKNRQNIRRSIILPNSSVSDFINRSFVFSAVFFSFLLLFRVFGETFRRSKTRIHGIFSAQPKPGGKLMESDEREMKILFLREKYRESDYETLRAKRQLRREAKYIFRNVKNIIARGKSNLNSFVCCRTFFACIFQFASPFVFDFSPLCTRVFLVLTRVFSPPFFADRDNARKQNV